MEKYSGQEDFRFSCVAEGRPVAPFVTWNKNGYAITAAQDNKYQVQDGLKQSYWRYQVSVYIYKYFAQLFFANQAYIVPR